jgi:hypothetical protein
MVRTTRCVKLVAQRLDGVSLSKAFPVAGRSTRARATPQHRVPHACSLPVAIDKGSAR